MVERILIVGLGSIGKRHLRIARELFPNAKFAALRHTSSAQEFGGVINLFSLDDVLEFSPNIAVIANPAPYHIDIATSLADAGVNLFIEKPISDKTEGVDSLIEKCGEKGGVLFIGYTLRFISSLQYFRDCLLRQQLGKVLSVRAEVGQYLPEWRQGKDYRETVSAKSELGGGVLLELSHELDYLRWIFGEVDWVSAYCGKQSDLDIDVEDTALLTLGFENNLVASLNLDFIRHDTTRACTAICENGSLRWNGIEDTVEVLEKGDKEWIQLFVGDKDISLAYMEEWRHFLNCIEKKEEPVVSGYDGLKALKLVEAAKESSASGRVVKQ